MQPSHCSVRALPASFTVLALGLVVAEGCGKTVEDDGEASTISGSTDSAGAQASGGATSAGGSPSGAACDTPAFTIPTNTSGSCPSEPCPVAAPALGSACSGYNRCSYTACEQTNADVWVCDQGAWVHARAPECIAQSCPASLPEPGDLCEGPYSGHCTFSADCCGDSRQVTAQCQGGYWHIYDAEPSACSYCNEALVDGAECKLPAGCSSLICYRTICYDDQMVGRCINGRWAVEDNCSK